MIFSQLEKYGKKLISNVSLRFHYDWTPILASIWFFDSLNYMIDAKYLPIWALSHLRQDLHLVYDESLGRSVRVSDIILCSIDRYKIFSSLDCSTTSEAYIQCFDRAKAFSGEFVVDWNNPRHMMDYYSSVCKCLLLGRRPLKLDSMRRHNLEVISDQLIEKEDSLGTYLQNFLNDDLETCQNDIINNILNQKDLWMR